MARLIERTFQPNEPTVVRRFFVAAGRHFNPGDVFDWRRLAVAQRRVKQLFDNGKLMHPETAAEAVVEPVIEVGAVGAILTPEPSIEQEMQDEDIAHVAATAEDDEPGPADLVEAGDDGLDALNMRELRAIAEAEGAPTRLRREDQRQAIREHRRG